MGRKFSRQRFDAEHGIRWPAPAAEAIEKVREERRAEAAETAEAEPECSPSPCGMASIIVGVCSLLVLPFLLGPTAIVLGAIALGQKDNRGLWGILLGIAGTVIGTVLVLLVFGTGLLFGL